MCAEHDRQLGGASPLHNLMEVTAKRKGGVARRGLKEACSKGAEPAVVRGSGRTYLGSSALALFSDWGRRKTF